MLTVFSGNIDYISPLGTKILPSASRRAIFRPSGANIINVALNPSQYLYNIKALNHCFFKDIFS